MPKNKEQKIKLRLLYDLLYRETDEDNALSTEQIITIRNKYGGISAYAISKSIV